MTNTYTKLSYTEKLDLYMHSLSSNAYTDVMISLKDSYDIAKSDTKKKKVCDDMYFHSLSCDISNSHKDSKKISPYKTLAEAVFYFYRYDNNKENIYMKHESLDFENLIKTGNTDKKRWMTLLTAYCQSGKTFLIIACMAVYLALGITPVFIVKDRINRLQAYTRISKSFSNLRIFLSKHGYKEERKIYSDCLYMDSQSDISQNEYKKKITHSLIGGMSNNKRRIVMCIKHEMHVRRVNECLTSLSQFALIIDEAHILSGYKYLGDGSGEDMYDEGVAYDRELHALKNDIHCKKLIEITATAQSILVSNPKLYTKGILHIQASSEHRNLSNVIFDTTHHEDEKRDKREYREKIKNTRAIDELSVYAFPQSMLTFLYEKSISPSYIRTNKFGVEDRLAIHALIKHDRLVSEQHKLMITFKDTAIPTCEKHAVIIASKWVVMTIQSEGIRVYHSDLIGKTININGEVVTSNDVGEFLFTKAEICDIWQYLEMNGGVDTYPRRVCIAYNSVEEGVTFSGYYDATDPSVDKNLHLTDIYINMPNTAPTCRLRQSIERGSGNHGDDISINVYCCQLIKEKWVKSVAVLDEHLTFLQTLSQDGRDIKVIDAIKEHSIYENRIPKNYIKVKGGIDNVSKKENPNGNDEDDELRIKIKGIHALNFIAPDVYKIHILSRSQLDLIELREEKLEQESEILEETLIHRSKSIMKTKDKDKEEEQVTRDIINEDEDTNESIVKLLACYKNRGKLFDIIQAFIRHKKRVLSREILTEACDGKFKHDNFDHWDLGRHSKYHIIDHVEEGRYGKYGRWRLRDNIIRVLDINNALSNKRS
jgi:hypothetical protein